MILKQRAALGHPTLPVFPWHFRVSELCRATILDCRLIHGISRESPETFQNDHLFVKDILKHLRKFKEFGIRFKRRETRIYRTKYDARLDDKTWATRLIRFENHSSQWRWHASSYWWNLFSRWYDGFYEISNLGNASWKIPRLHGISKLESQLQDWSMCNDSESSNHNALDHRSWESTVNCRIDDIPIDSREKNFPDYEMLDVLIASSLKKASQLAYSLPEKSKCRRAPCSKKRPILASKTDCVHDLRAFSCNWCLWSTTRTLRLVQHTSPKWWCPRFPRTMGSGTVISKWNIYEYSPGRIIQVKITGFCSATDCIWLCMIKKLYETKDRQVIQDWKHQWDYTLIKRWDVQNSKLGTKWLIEE